MRCRSCSTLCGTVGLIVGVLAGIGAGLLFFYELLPGLATVLPITLTLGAVATALLLVGIAVAGIRPNTVLAACLAANGNRLLTGALGTVISTLTLLVFNTGPLFNLRLVLVSVVALFLAYLAVQIVCFVTCVTRRLGGDNGTC